MAIFNLDQFLLKFNFSPTFLVLLKNNGLFYVLFLTLKTSGPKVCHPQSERVNHVTWINLKSLNIENLNKSSRSCAEYFVHNSKWSSYDCSKGQQFICQIYLSADRQHPKIEIDKDWPTDGGCKKGWKKFAKSCFRIFGSKYEDGSKKSGLDFDSAQMECSKQWSGPGSNRIDWLWFANFAFLILIRNSRKNFDSLGESKYDFPIILILIIFFRDSFWFDFDSLRSIIFLRIMIHKWIKNRKKTNHELFFSDDSIDSI